MTAEGAVLAPCADGQAPRIDNVTVTLFCPARIPETSQWGVFVGLSVAVIAGLLVFAYVYRKRTPSNPTPARATTDAARPPTLTIEYHLVPATLI